MSTLIRYVLLTTALVSANAQAFDRGNVQGRLATHLTPEELEREKRDEKRFPHIMAYLKALDVSKGIGPSDPRNAHLIKTAQIFTPTQAMWNGFFKAAAEDRVTSLRAFALIAREIKKNGVVVFGPGRDFENAVKDNRIDMGLALPAHSIGTAIWAPDPDNKDPEFLLHLKIFYTEPYIHKFPDHILPANLKVGFGEPETYWMEGKEYRQHTVDTDLYYGPTQGVGFRNVKGIGGQKRGFLGFLQKVAFFLSDAVGAMTIDESKDAMITEALINTVVKEFETDPKYSIKVMPKP